jgi:hypothetical protein
MVASTLFLGLSPQAGIKRAFGACFITVCHTIKNVYCRFAYALRGCVERHSALNSGLDKDGLRVNCVLLSGRQAGVIDVRWISAEGAAQHLSSAAILSPNNRD